MSRKAVISLSTGLENDLTITAFPDDGGAPSSPIRRLGARSVQSF